MNRLQIIEDIPNTSEQDGLSGTVCDILQSNGISVERIHQDTALTTFADAPAVLEKLASPRNLPIVLINGRIAMTGFYPDRRELTEWLELDVNVLNVPRCCCGSGRRCCWCGRYYLDGKNL